MYAARCNLSGFVHKDDMVARRAAAGGGTIEIERSASLGFGFGRLAVLDLSENPGIANFGFDGASAGKELCWSELELGAQRIWLGLQKLILRGCTNLKYLHPKVYSVSMLDIDATPALVTPHVTLNASGCQEYLASEADFCTGVTWKACLYREPLYTPVSKNSECSLLARAGSPRIFMTPSMFKPEVLCRCFAGYEGMGTNCSECPADTWSGKGSSACTRCPANSTTFGQQTQQFQSACQCRAGMFVEFEGTSSQKCSMCPLNTERTLPGARSVTECIKCDTGFYSLPGISTSPVRTQYRM